MESSISTYLEGKNKGVIIAGLACTAAAYYAGWVAGRWYSSRLFEQKVVPLHAIVPAARTYKREVSDASSVASDSHLDTGSVTPSPRSADGPAKLKMVICVRRDLELCTSATAAQCVHAALAMFKKLYARHNPHLSAWQKQGSPKAVVGVSDEDELFDVHAAAKAIGLPTQVVADNAVNGVKTRSVLVIGPAPADHVNEVTAKLSLL